MSIEQDAIELGTDVGETRISHGTSSKSVHLRLSHLVPAIVEKKLWRPECCNHKIITEAMGFTVCSFTLLPIVFN
jgi:hypothetical protein